MTKLGRPAFEATEERRRTVESMAGLGLTREQIADVLGTSVVTLRKQFKLELKRGDALASLKVAQSLFTAATSWLRPQPDGSLGGTPDRAAITAAIWWEKTRAGRSDRVSVDSKVNADVKSEGTVKISTEAADAEALALLQRVEAQLRGDDGAGLGS